MDANTLITEFFGPSNGLSLASFAERRARWLDSLRLERERTRMSFLPHRSADGRVVWFAIGPPDMPAGELLELCHGFVGPSYAEQVALLRPDGATESHAAALLDYVRAFSGAVARVDLGIITKARIEDAERSAEAFERLELLIEGRPAWAGYGTRSLAQVLADLDLALAEGDAAGAEELLLEVERSHSISEVNLQFLQIRMLQAIGRGSEVLEHPNLGYLVQARRPRKVTKALLEAAFDVHLADVGMDPASLRPAGEAVLAALGPAATELVDPTTSKEAMVLLASGLAYGRGREALQHVLEWFERQGIDSGPVEALFPEASAEQPAAAAPDELGFPDEIAEAADLVMDGRPTEALAILIRQDPSVRVARIAFLVDALLGTIQSAEVLLDVGLPILDELEAAQDAKMLQRLDELTGFRPELSIAAESDGASSDALPTSWQDWVELVRTRLDRSSFEDLASRGAASWSSDAASATAIARAIEDVTVAQATTIRSCAGIIVDAHSEILDVSASLELRAALLELIAVSGLPTTQELRTVIGWVEAIMSSAVDSAIASRALDALEVFIAPHPSPALAEVLADLAAIVAHHAGGGEHGRSFVLKAVASIRAAGATADRAVRATAARASADAGAPVPDDDPFWTEIDSDGNWMQLLDGLHLGIHTLMGSVASRARAAVEPSVGDGSVTTNDDHVATDSLRGMATGSDVVVLVTAAAKHPATQEVERLCPEERLVRVASKGLSGLLRELEKHVRSRFSARALSN